MRAREKEQPWWLTGTEICPECGQGYAVEMEFRCASCDAQLCSCCCVASDDGVVLCCACRG